MISPLQRISPWISPFTFSTFSKRFASKLAPARVAHPKHHKGRIPVRIGGSIKGTTLNFGDYGLRLKQGTRLTSTQLSTAQEAIRLKLKNVKGIKVYLRVFPDIPVCTKGNETRMGKGKGSLEYWCARVPVGKVVLEVGGDLQPQLAKEALRLASVKFPVRTEVITKNDLPRLGNLIVGKE